jgi:hypothetical protein
MTIYNLPVDYTMLPTREKKAVREQYIKEQDGKCWFCGEPLDGPPAEKVQNAPIIWQLFPPGFQKNPVHLQHDHDTNLTEGAVHMKCNAFLWQYLGK